ncbi:putative alpha/Beta hydrolase [Helianthus annuus]|nr:putative alpha/Beta hydrolase [Helianthus annuus]
MNKDVFLLNDRVLENISDSIVAIYTQEGHHCRDMYPPMDSDPEWLIAQRMAEIKVIEGWLATYPHP